MSVLQRYINVGSTYSLVVMIFKLAIALLEKEFYSGMQVLRYIFQHNQAA